MILNALIDTHKKGELILIDGGFCRWHLLKNGQLTIYEIFSSRPGAGTEMLNFLKLRPAMSIFAKCPEDYPSNKWYRKKGFELEKVQVTPKGKKINHWRLTGWRTDRFILEGLIAVVSNDSDESPKRIVDFLQKMYPNTFALILRKLTVTEDITDRTDLLNHVLRFFRLEIELKELRGLILHE